MAIAVLKVRAGTSGNWTALATPVDMTVSFQALDSAKSGRDNNTGAMFRDLVTKKLTAKIKIPYGVSNTELKNVLDVISGGSFYCYIFDPLTGSWHGDKRFYCSSVEPPIAKVSTGIVSGSETVTGWIYDEFELSFVQM